MFSRVSRFTGRRWMTALVVSAAVILAFLANTAAPPPTGPVSFDQLDAWLDHEVHDAGYPGAAAVVVEGGRIVHTHAVGVADDAGRPVTAQTPFTIGSLSKSFTALAIGQLAEAGRIDLDAPVVRYLPEFRVADQVATRTVTVRQLLIQTSGLPTSAGTAPLLTPATTLDARVRDLATVVPAAAPGAGYIYSNANYLVLGRIVEVVSGQSYGDYLAQHVLAPLDMRHTWTDGASARLDGLTRAHRLWFGLADSHDALLRSDMVPAGFIASSAEDLGHMLIAQLDGGRYGSATIASPATIAQLQHGVAPTGVADSRYAMGWVDASLDGERLVAHAGSTTDTASYAAMVPGRGLGIAVLFNGQSVLYELAQKPDLIGMAMTAKLMGVEPTGTLDLLYPAVDVMAALLVLSMLRGTWQAARRAPAARWSHRRRIAVMLRGYLDVFVPFVIVTRTPDVLGAGWDVLVRRDIGLLLAVVVAIRITDGLVRVSVWARRRGAPGAAPADASVDPASADTTAPTVPSPTHAAVG